MRTDEIANYSVPERLNDGRQLVIRAVRPDDKGGMAEALRAVSAESFYFRAFAPKRSLGDDELTQLTAVDFGNVVALVAVVNDGLQERIVGGGRYVRMEMAGAPSKAEIAFLVEDEYQCHGIGSLLFRHLVRIALASGVAAFEADVLPGNDRMLRLFDRSGLPVAATMMPDAVHVTIELRREEESAGRRNAA